MGEARLFLWIALISTCGFSMTWTGLPIWLAKQSGNPSRLGDLFVVSAVTTLFFALVGGQLTDKFSKKTLTIGAEIASALMLLLVLWVSNVGQAGHPLLLLLLFFYFAVRAIGSNAESVWFLSTPASSGLAASATNRQLVLTGAKILGMSSGPFLFQTLGTNALLLTIFGFGLTAILFSRISEHRELADSTGPEPSARDILRSLRETSPARGLLMFTTGLLGVPLVNFNLNRLLAAAPGGAASVFWGIMPIMSLTGGYLSKRLLAKNIPSATVLFGFGFGACFAAFYSTFFVGLPIFLSVVVFALTNQSVRTLLGVKYFEDAPVSAKGRTMATVTAVEDLGELSGHLLVSYVLVDQLWLFGLVGFSAAVYRVMILSRFRTSLSPSL